jgi:hypothetical protein
VGALEYRSQHGEGEEPTNDSPEYRFHTMRETQPLLRYLSRWDLSFDIVLPVHANNSPPIWQLLDSKINEHLDRHNFGITKDPSPASVAGDAYSSLPWHLLEVKSNNMQQNRALTPYSIFGRLFNEEVLHAVSKRIPHPENKEIHIAFVGT